MLGRRAEPGGDQERAELVAVQGGGVRLIVQPGTPDVRGRGVVEELFLDGVLVEPGDGAQSAGDRGASPAAGFQFAGEGLDVGAADREQRQGPGAAPAGELAQVEGAGLAGQAAVPGQEPGEREPLGISESRLDGCEGVDVGVDVDVGVGVAVIRAPPGQPGPGGWAVVGASDKRCPKRMPVAGALQPPSVVNPPSPPQSASAPYRRLCPRQAPCP